MAVELHGLSLQRLSAHRRDDARSRRMSPGRMSRSIRSRKRSPRPISRSIPFGRVPTLVHDGFVLYETTAITRYIDEAFPGTSLQPADPRERARMNQIIAVADSYGYWPMVRQVFSHRVFRPAQGRAGDEAAIAEGLEKSKRCSRRLENLAAGGPFLAGSSLSLADLHLGAMVAYFTAAARGPRDSCVTANFGMVGRVSERPSLCEPILACRHPEPARSLRRSCLSALCKEGFRSGSSAPAWPNG